MKVLPPIPTQFHSAHGPIPISAVNRCDEECANLCGRYAFGKRTLEVAMDMAPVAQWITLWHEAMHVALIEGGGANALTKDQSEVVCDVMGSYLTGMMQAGWLAVTIPRSTGTAKKKK